MEEKSHVVTEVAGPTSQCDVTVESRSNEQQFERYISLAGFYNFGMCLQCGWEATSIGLILPLLNGGPAALVWGVLISGAGHLFTVFSLAEMASMDPTVGAQYRWSARFARSNPEFWGFVQGWVTTFAWLVQPAAWTSYLAYQTQALISFHNPEFIASGWHTTLIMWAYISAAVVCNLYLRRILNVFETIGGICHVLFWVTCIIVLTTLANRSSPTFVFTKVTTGLTGWNNPGLCFQIGLMNQLLGLAGYDSMLHMVDETKKPRERVPPSMIVAVASNVVMTFSYVLVLMFCIGDEEAVMAAPSPLLEIYYQATKSKAASTICLFMHMLVLTTGSFNTIASTSRLVWAFARDRGLPNSAFFTPVHPTLQIPLRSLGLTIVIAVILSLVNLGSSVALSQLISIGTIGLIGSYFFPVFLILKRKIAGQHPNYGPFRLGRWGIPVNLCSLCFTAYVTFWAAFPSTSPITSDNMNYGGPVFIGLLTLCIGDWFRSGKKRFVVPTGKYAIEMAGQEEVEMK
ncbi:amino acid transporter [Sporormia fimetaria CBS 119925]|uniref:Amino acid transporter n=1 Tax=Sporormia fimetaria CBS 119925 TaxID=1340428 RepID=A0A6A6VDE0_9PLEO|nr:amino acid transporter [Sporormia fimetaria CBS 119925]